MACSEKVQRNKTRVASELPEELVFGEILTRLAIKSAVRFKCVSKSWLSLLSNPEFLKRRLTLNTTQNPNDYDCLIATKYDKIVILSRYKEAPALLPRGGFGLVGSIRGLVCLCRRDFFSSKLSLWNPAIRQSKEFTLPSNIRYQINTMGFGFDPVNDNYKVVVLSHELRSASVYHSNSDSWIDVFVPENVYLLQNREHLLHTDHITIIKDCPYWIFYRFTHDRRSERKPHRYKTQVLVPTAVYLTIVKFDAGSNEFKLLPEFYFDIKVRGERYAFTYKFVAMNDCPTLIVYDKKSWKCMLDIYSLDGEEECCVWIKTYSIEPPDFHRPFWDVSQGFYGGEIVFHDHGMFFCYDRKTDTIKRLSRPSTTISHIVSCFRYTPSMVYLEGMKSV